MNGRRGIAMNTSDTYDKTVSILSLLGMLKGPSCSFISIKQYFTFAIAIAIALKEIVSNRLFCWHSSRVLWGCLENSVSSCRPSK